MNEPAVVELWLERLAEVRRAPGRRPAGAPSPYRGLESFQAEHAGWFHGRDRVVRHLVRELRARASGTTGPLVAVGPSGPGKSSVLRAGLIPALRRGELGEGSATWPVILLTPGTHPLHTLTAGLTPLVPDGGGDAEALLTRAGAGDGRLVIVVDQFEEIFTACADHGERRAFADALCAAADQKGGALVVLGVRADFYPHVLRFPRLARALQEGQVVIGPMTEDELREVIVGPARKARLDIEDGLVELLLRDLRPLTAEGGTGAAHDAGGLPLLSYALLATWQRSRGRRLTVPDYRGCGGISGAVADTAELAYAELTPAQRSLARRIFIRLVHVADDMADSRRRLTLERLLSDTGHTASEELQDVLDTFVERRLITVGSDAVEITHEALIHAWPRLRAWIDADRAGLIVAQQFADAALAWQREGRDPASLYRGARLAAVREWADSGHQDELSSSTRDFLAASIGLEEEGLRVARRRTRRLRSLVAVLATLVLLTVTATGLALRGQRTLTEERDMAVSRQLAADADRLRGSDPGLAAQIALTAFRVAPTVEARSSLLSAYGGPSVTRLLGPAGVPRRMAFSPDGRLMATADATLRLWRIPPGSGAAVALGAPVATEPSRTLVFSPDGRTLAAFAEAGTVRLWDVADPARPAPISAPITSPGGAAPAYSPDGRILAAGGSNGTVTVYDVAGPRRPRRLGAPLTGHSGAVQTVVFSPDGRLLAAGSADHTVRLWDLTDPARPVRVGAPISGSSSVLHLTFAPGGATLAVAASGEEKTVRLYDVTRPGRPARLGAPIEGPAGLVNFADFSPDGKTLAVASSDNKAWVWDLATRRTIALLPHPAPVAEARFLDANRLITTAEDGTIRLWTLPGPLITDPKDTVFTAAIGTDGRHLLVGADGSDETVRLYDIADPRRPAPLGPPMSVPTGLGLSGAAAQRPGGGLVAAGTLDGPVHLFDVRDPGRPVRLEPPLTGAKANIESVAFAPDGRTVAAASDDATVRLWDVTDPGSPVPLKTLDDAGANVYATAFSADGRLLAAGSGDNNAYLWDVTDRAHPVRVAPPLTGHTQEVYSVALSGHLLAAGGADKTVRLWDISDPRRPRPVGRPLTGPNNIVYWLSFSPGGGLLAAGSGDGTVWLWDMRDPARATTYANLAGLTNSVWMVGFSPDGKILAAGGADKAVRLWSMDAERVAAHVCAVAGDPITATEWNRYLPGLPYDPPCPP